MSAIHPMIDRYRTRVSLLLAFLAPLAIYLRTMAPTIYNLDSAEFTTAAYTGGIVRATGYPLYLLIGRFWSRLPIGDVGYRMNLLSAVCGAFTIFLTARIMSRFGVRGWSLFAALGLLATMRYFWGLSLIAEAYTLSTLLMCVVIMALLRWAEKPGAVRLAVATGTVGVAVGHHLAAVLLAPACLWYVLRTDHRTALSPRSLGAAAIGLVSGLSLYLYLPWVYQTAPAFNYAGHFDAAGVFQATDLTTVSGLWWLVSGRSFAGQMGAYQGGALLHEIGHFASELWNAFSAIGIGPALVGIVVLWRRRRRECEMLVLMFVVSAGFYIDYAVADKDTMFLPAYLVWAVWLAIGYQFLLEWVGDHPPMRYFRSATIPVFLLRAVMVSVVLFSLTWNWPRVDLAHDFSTRLRGEAILRRVESGGLVIGWWDTVPVIEYLQLVEGVRPDVVPLNRFLIAESDLKILVRSEVGKRPVYLSEEAEDLFPELDFQPVGQVFRLSKRKLKIEVESDRSDISEK